MIEITTKIQLEPQIEKALRNRISLYNKRHEQEISIRDIESIIVRQGFLIFKFPNRVIISI